MSNIGDAQMSFSSGSFIINMKRDTCYVFLVQCNIFHLFSNYNSIRVSTESNWIYSRLVLITKQEYTINTDPDTSIILTFHKLIQNKIKIWYNFTTTVQLNFIDFLKGENAIKPFIKAYNLACQGSAFVLIHSLF